MRLKTVVTSEEHVLLVRPNAMDPEEWADIGLLVPSQPRKPFFGGDGLPAFHFVPHPGIDLDEYDLEAVLSILKARRRNDSRG